jgi:Bifunctional DNA primase/polymerase, N-terminal
MHHSPMTVAERAAHSAAMRLGYPAFPCNAEKIPLCQHGFKDACSGIALDRLFRRYPGVLIGVPTGPASGLAVLDVDPAKGGTPWWDQNKDRLPQTRLHETKSGGIHALFRHRDGLKCSVAKIAPGIDVRGEGGYIIWWPVHGFSVVDHPLAEWPAWLKPPDPEPIQFVPRTPTAPVNCSRYAEVALDRACAAISGAANGEQEATLNGQAFGIGALVGAGVLDRATALNRITAAAMLMPSYEPRKPWTEREIDTKVNRSFKLGFQRPRQPLRRVG